MRLGILLSLSCCVTSLSLLGFVISDNSCFLVIASFCLGAGGGAIDSSINTFAAISFSPRIVNWLHAFYGIGATLGPLILTWFITQRNTWHSGYVTVASIQLFLAILFIVTNKFWDIKGKRSIPTAPISRRETLRMPALWIGVVAFFIYTGIEFGMGEWTFTVLTKSRMMDAIVAGYWVSAYYACFTGGRMVAGVLLSHVSIKKVLIFSIFGIVTGALMIASGISSAITLSGIIITGVFCGPIFPCLISFTPQRMGKSHTANAIGFQVGAAAVGSAVLPGFSGYLAKHFGWEFIPKLHVVEGIFLFSVILYLILSGGKTKSFNESKHCEEG